MDWLLKFLERPASFSYHYERAGCLALPWKPFMFVNDNVRKCVFFLASRKGENYTLRSTGFFMMHKIEGTRQYQLYAVSAAHCIEKARDNSQDGRIYLCVNAKSGRADDYIPTDFDSWELHEDQRTDIAVAPLDWADEIFKTHIQIPINSEYVITNEDIRTLRVSPGDDLYFPGLFVRIPGESSNIPILRTGTLAALANEPIRTERGMFPAHLAEMRSIGGHSGSPVFLHLHYFDRTYPFKDNADAKQVLEAFGGVPPLLGFIHGYVPFRRDDFSTELTDGDAHSHPNDRQVEDFNSGIAVIVPATEIINVLNQERLLELRLKRRDQINSQYGGTIET